MADICCYSFRKLYSKAGLLHFISSLPPGSVDLRYKLGLITHKYQLTHRNLADGYPHYVNITRHNRTIKTQVHAIIDFMYTLACVSYSVLEDYFAKN